MRQQPPAVAIVITEFVLSIGRCSTDRMQNFAAEDEAAVVVNGLPEAERILQNELDADLQPGIASASP